MFSPKYLEFLKTILFSLNLKLKMSYFFNVKQMEASHQQQLEPRYLGSRTQSITYTPAYTKLADLFFNTTLFGGGQRRYSFLCFLFGPISNFVIL